jgi:hypothetical protein
MNKTTKIQKVMGANMQQVDVLAQKFDLQKQNMLVVNSGCE